MNSFLLFIIGLALGYFIGRFSDELSIFFKNIKERGVN